MQKNRLSRLGGTTLVMSMLLAMTPGCTTTSPSSAKANAKVTVSKKHKINAEVDASLTKLYGTVPGSRELVKKAYGVLAFPSTVAAGFVVGAEYGEGALLNTAGSPLGYYRTISGSFGWQIGAQSKDLFFLFMTKDAYEKFVNSDGWTAGADASVAAVNIGANGVIDTNTVRGAVVALVVTNTGLMANLSVEGTKISKMDD